MCHTHIWSYENCNHVARGLGYCDRCTEHPDPSTWHALTLLVATRCVICIDRDIEVTQHHLQEARRLVWNEDTLPMLMARHTEEDWESIRAAGLESMQLRDELTATLEQLHGEHRHRLACERRELREALAALGE